MQGKTSDGLVFWKNEPKSVWSDGLCMVNITTFLLFRLRGGMVSRLLVQDVKNLG